MAKLITQDWWQQQKNKKIYFCFVFLTISHMFDMVVYFCYFHWKNNFTWYLIVFFIFDKFSDRFIYLIHFSRVDKNIFILTLDNLTERIYFTFFWNDSKDMYDADVLLVKVHIKTWKSQKLTRYFQGLFYLYTYYYHKMFNKTLFHSLKESTFRMKVWNLFHQYLKNLNLY